MFRWFGLDGGPFYNFYSGVFGVLTVAAGIWLSAWTAYRARVCKMKWCPRLGEHDFTSPESGVVRKLCWKHHPDVTHKNLTRERLHLYLGDKPGRG